MSTLQSEDTRRFPAVDTPYRDTGVAPYVVRPLFFVATVFVVICALGQLGGRILFANLERLEPRINAALADQGVVLTGLSGDWRFLNPVLRVSSGQVPGVRFKQAWAEIDALESFSRNRVVLRNANVQDVALTLAQDDAGQWSIDGLRASDSNFDWLSLLWHSDQLSLGAQVALQASDRELSELHLEGSLSNFGGRHRGEILLRETQSCDSCELRARYNVEESALWFRPRSGSALLTVNNLELRESAAALAGVEALTLGTVNGRFRLLEDRFSGPLQAHQSEFTLRGGQPTTLDLLADGWSFDDGSVAALGVEALQVASATDQLEVRDAKLNWSIENGLVFRVPTVDVGSITQLAGHILDPQIPTAMWIKRLGMTGSFTRLLGSWQRSAGLGFAGDFNSVDMKNFRGVPAVTDLAGSFTAGPGYLQMRMRDAVATVGFPELYREERNYGSVTGEVLMFFGQDYFGLTGSNLSFLDDGVSTAGAFSLVSAKPLTNNHLTIALASDAGEFADLAPYVPYKLPQDTLDWLQQSGLEADLEAPRFVMHSPLREEESDMGRSYLIEARMQDAEMQFNAEWPRVKNARGLVRVSHSTINARVEQATMAGLDLDAMDIRLPAGASRLTARGRVTLDAETGLEFIRTTPLKDSMDFVADDWNADGTMRLNVDLDLPLDAGVGEELDQRVAVEIDGEMQGVRFAMPEAGLEFSDLRGPLNYSYPYSVWGNNIAGTFFARPMQLSISNERVGPAPEGMETRFAPRRIDFSVAGKMLSDDMWPLIGMDPSDVVDGVFDFEAVYSTETDTGVLPVLVATTNLQGATVNLPSPMGKTASDAADLDVVVNFGSNSTRANLLYRGLLSADLGIADEEISGGHLHLFSASSTGALQGSGRIARWDGNAGPILIDGELDVADVAEWAGGESSVALPPYRISDLNIAVATLGEFEIPQVVLNGSSDAGALVLAFDSATVGGQLKVPVEGRSELRLTEFIYGEAPPESATQALTDSAAGVAVTPKPDPVTPEMMASLQDMRVLIDSLSIDGEDFGRWEFDITRSEAGVAFSDLKATLFEVSVTSSEGVLWTEADNRTRFAGELTAEDMGDVLEAWGYARSLESESMLTVADVSWPGSPLNFELLQLRGTINAGVRSGRFLDVSSGNNALRIFSLLNFTAIAKRMSLNFKDVFGRGISFDKLEAATRLDSGMLVFTQPMRVEGTGGDFKVNGNINLADGMLDNEMVVTLPVNKSLPWLGAYLAIANPVVGLGVLVGERILRKPIRGLSSAKYSITGPADDPELELVRVFDRSMDDGDVAVEEDAEGIIIDTLPADAAESGPDTDSVVDQTDTDVTDTKLIDTNLIDTDQSEKESVPDGSIAIIPGT